MKGIAMEDPNESLDASGYGIDALPYGVFDVGGEPRVGTRLGDEVVDLAEIAGKLNSPLRRQFAQRNLDVLLVAGKPVWDIARDTIVDWLTNPVHAAVVREATWPLSDVEMHMPFTVADYVDFFSSQDHAENLSAILRPSQPPLQPNWLSLPVGYHGRAGTVVPSGTPVVRPSGQRPQGGVDPSDFGPTKKLDVEVEVGFVVGTASPQGGPGIRTADFEEHVFGVVLVNDWSARDIQAFEYVPLGPMLGKSFATSVSHWVLPLSALSHARVPAPTRSRTPLPYLMSESDWGLDIDLTLEINGVVLSRPQFRGMYWTPDQQLAHMTVNGAHARTGDLYASGTVSSPNNFGSLIEITGNGTASWDSPDTGPRTFLEDNDEVVITATAQGANGNRIRLGEVRGTIMPPKSPISRLI